MTRFLVSFLSIYSLMHALFYFRARVLLPARWSYQVPLILFLAYMVVAPIVTRLLERNDWYALARISATVGYTWMGYLFYAFWGFLVMGAIGFALRIVNTTAGWSLPTFQGEKAAAAILSIALLINIYGYFEARSIRVEKIAIKSSKLPAGVDRIRIGQISDVHLGLLVGEGRMGRIIDKMRLENPGYSCKHRRPGRRRHRQDG